MIKKILSRDNLYPPLEIYSEINNIDILNEWEKYVNNNVDNKLGLYIHIPFCLTKCSFCYCKSFVLKKEQIDLYIDYLKSEIEKISKIFKNKKNINNIYF